MFDVPGNFFSFSSNDIKLHRSMWVSERPTATRHCICFYVNVLHFYAYGRFYSKHLKGFWSGPSLMLVFVCFISGPHQQTAPESISPLVQFTIKKKKILAMHLSYTFSHFKCFLGIKTTTFALVVLYHLSYTIAAHNICCVMLTGRKLWLDVQGPSRACDVPTLLDSPKLLL